MTTGLKLSILSPERKLLEAAFVQEATLPGSEGQIQILPGHAPFVSTLETGVFEYTLENGEKLSGVISTGVVEVRGEEATVMAETLELRAEIDVERAKLAQGKSEEILQSPDLDSANFRKYQLKLQRALIRQHLASRGE